MESSCCLETADFTYTIGEMDLEPICAYCFSETGPEGPELDG